MPKFVTINPVIIVGGSTVTASCASATISLESDDVETTSFGSDWRTRVGGLKGGSVDFEFHQDFGAGGVDSLLYPLLGGTAAVSIKPGGTAATSATNPAYTFDVLVAQYSPMDSAVGDLATVSVSFPVTGPVTRATA